MPDYTVQTMYFGAFTKTLNVEAADVAEACQKAVAAANAGEGQWRAVGDDCLPTFVEAVAEGADADLAGRTETVPAAYDETSVMRSAYDTGREYVLMIQTRDPGLYNGPRLTCHDTLDNAMADLAKWVAEEVEAQDQRYLSPMTRAAWDRTYKPGIRKALADGDVAKAADRWFEYDAPADNRRWNIYHPDLGNDLGHKAPTLPAAEPAPHPALEEIARLLCPGGDADGAVDGADFIDQITRVLEKYGVDKTRYAATA